jgi:chorismate synthase
MPNTFGHVYRITTFGESHGGAVGVVIDGVPPGHPLDLARVQGWLDRRKPGQSKISSPRKEKDQVECLSGMENGLTLGTPLTLIVRNEDQIPAHYSDLAQVFRPSHADYTTWAKYGVRPSSGGGRASARETIGRVAAAAVAEQLLERLAPGFRVVAWVDSVKGQEAAIPDPAAVTRDQVEEHILRCPDKASRDTLERVITDAQKMGDTVGGTIACAISGVPVGLGDPVFDKLEADLAKAMMSLPASKGFEVGLGFRSTLLYGSEHNDAFTSDDAGRIRTATNRSGGIQGGISNGELVYLRVAFKPVSTIFKEQDTVDAAGNQVRMRPKAGRHDPCVLPRAVPMVEAMAALVVMDHLLRQRVIEGSRGQEPSGK